MTVKSEHAPYIVHVGMIVELTLSQPVKELAGARCRVVRKNLGRSSIDTRPVGETREVLIYQVQVLAPRDKLPTELWVCRCGFKVVR